MLGLGVIKGVVVAYLQEGQMVVDFIGEVERDHVEHVHDDEEGIHLDRVADQDELIDGQAEQDEVRDPGGSAEVSEKTYLLRQGGGGRSSEWITYLSSLMSTD